MEMRHILALILSITATYAADIEINCDYKTDQSPYAAITTPKFTVCELQNDLKPTDTIKTAIGNTATPNIDVKIFISNEKKVLQIPDGLKAVFSGLEGIKLDSTDFKFLDSEKLKALTGLKYLGITNGLISVIFAETFKDLADLILIDLTGNPIMYIGSAAFDGTTNLEHLMLTDAMCVTAATKIATTKPEVETLVDSLPGACDKAALLETNLISTTKDLLAASSATECEPCTNETECPVEDCTEELEDINSRLDLTVGNLTECKSDVSVLSDDVKNLQKKVDELEALTGITADGTCGYKTVSSVYSCYAKISIKTAADQTVKWNGTHESNKKDVNVVSMVIYGQTVEIMPLNIGSTFTNLKSLTVKNSGLTKIKSGDLKNLAKLETLVISGNSITAIDAEAFTGLSSVKELDMSANKITALPIKVFETMSALSILNLSENSLKIRFDIINTTNNILEAYLGNNLANYPLDRALIWRLQKAVKIDLSGTGCAFSLDKKAKPQTFMDFYSTVAKNC